MDFKPYCFILHVNCGALKFSKFEMDLFHNESLCKSFRDQIAQLDQEIRELQKELDLAGSKQNYQKVIKNHVFCFLQVLSTSTIEI